MTALSVAKEALQRKESSGPKALAKKAAKEGSTIVTVPEVQYSISDLLTMRTSGSSGAVHVCSLSDNPECHRKSHNCCCCHLNRLQALLS